MRRAQHRSSSHARALSIQGCPEEGPSIGCLTCVVRRPSFADVCLTPPSRSADIQSPMKRSMPKRSSAAHRVDKRVDAGVDDAVDAAVDHRGKLGGRQADEGRADAHRLDHRQPRGWCSEPLAQGRSRIVKRRIDSECDPCGECVGDGLVGAGRWFGSASGMPGFFRSELHPGRRLVDDLRTSAFITRDMWASAAFL